MKNALIIFVRNPELGKVKTRLATGIGDEKALLVYKHLLQHTHNITTNVAATNFIFYTNYVNEKDIWIGYKKKLQHGNDLGERMLAAFNELFNAGYNKVCIIGSDCVELNTSIINNAFESLENSDLTIGPVADGGYYLLGLKKIIPQLFLNKKWSTSSVFAESLKDANNLGLRVNQLPLLNDIDTENDLITSSLAYLLDK